MADLRGRRRGYEEGENGGSGSHGRRWISWSTAMNLTVATWTNGLMLNGLPPAPPPPPFPEGYIPPTTEAEKGHEAQQAAEPQLPPIDPIIDQGFMFIVSDYSNINLLLWLKFTVVFEMG
ncbi:hypothetical protein L1049_017801 [Liquidambar formosana]|uniref:Uncharacterized protein n=1 Tax=Liquidambar formosana TaxID=63359 RepID=A0AAP0N6J3_LIQFO